ncbi:MAG: hypothetical protein M3360_01150 [Actinomycetota bacterium]|nr:hypothetical protein [Actinomycetota bacterium]
MGKDGYRNDPDPVAEAGDGLRQEEPQKIAILEQGQVGELLLGAEDPEVRALWCGLDMGLLVRRVPHIVKKQGDRRVEGRLTGASGAPKQGPSRRRRRAAG